MSTPRQTIDAQLSAAGWAVQDVARLNLSAFRGVAVRELRSQGGPADYILFVDGKALGVVEAKKAGTALTIVAEQSMRYSYARKWIGPDVCRYEEEPKETIQEGRERQFCAEGESGICGVERVGEVAGPPLSQEPWGNPSRRHLSPRRPRCLWLD